MKHLILNYRILIFSFITILYSISLYAQKIPIPSSWEVNVNGYEGTMQLNSIDPVTHALNGTILNSKIYGHIVDRHLQIYRIGTEQMYEAWVLDPALGAHGQSYYNGALFMTGTVSEAKGSADGVYPFYAKLNPSGTPPMVITEIDKKYMRTFEGKWNSNWGVMTLRVEGSKVIGEYTHDSGRIEATLSSDKRTMVGTWSEAPSYKPTNDAGQMTFVISEDGDKLTGKWGYGNKLTDGHWTGTRILPEN